MIACQSPAHHPGATPLTFMELTFQGAEVAAKGTIFPGAAWTEIACQSCASPRTDAVRAEGGTLVAAEMLVSQPPAPVTPEPVGLDAIDPTPALVEQPAPDQLGQVVAMANCIVTMSAALATVGVWLEQTGQAACQVRIEGVATPVELGLIVDRALGIGRPINEAVERTPWLREGRGISLPWEPGPEPVKVRVRSRTLAAGES